LTHKAVLGIIDLGYLLGILKPTAPNNVQLLEVFIMTRTTIGLSEISRRLGLAKHAVRKALDGHGVVPIKAARRVLYTKKDLVTWLGEGRVNELFADFFGDEKGGAP
jgi:hypothetical protein